MIEADEDDGGPRDEDMDSADALMALGEEEEQQLTEEERQQRAVELARAASMATELRAAIDVDNSDKCFFDHTDSVFCVALSSVHPDLALSGGGDDQAYLWSLSTGNRLFHFAGHTDSVIDVGFSADGRFVATASMDATVRVYNLSDGTLRHELKGPAKDLEWMQWHPMGNVIIAGSADETVTMWHAEK